MAGTKAGRILAKATMIAKFGSEEKLIEWHKTIGAKGGAAGNTGGFASNMVGKDGLTGRQRSMVAGKLGGAISRRKSKESIDSK